MEKEPIVLIDSPEAAVYESRTLTGWWSRLGFFFSDKKGGEEAARYNGATHRKCDCGEVIDKYRSRCGECQRRKDLEVVAAYPTVEWDMQMPLYSDQHDKYLWDLDDVYQLMDDDDDLQYGDTINLILCEPQYFQHVDSEYWQDVLPNEDYGGDGELPKLMQEKINELNKIIDEMAPASWLPGKKRVEFTFEGQ